MNASPRTRKFGFLRSIGPAIIVASVVLGPGSILSASKTGQQFGYTMVWTLAVAVMLMMGMTALGSRLAVFLDDTLCEELAKRGGRPVAALAGVTIFLIAACFQFGNNLGILAAIEPFYGNAPQDETSKTVLLGVILALNLVVIVAIFGLTGLYQRIERLMKILVGLMMIGFAGNLLLARPDVIETLRGLVPGVPDGAFETLLPRWQEATGERAGHIVDKLLPVTALFATTFVVGGAFFQAYLVRQKGWTSEDLRQGLVDSCVGIFALGVMTLMIMLTAASVLHDNENVGTLRSVADVARQLEPAFGAGAKLLFSLGIFAGAFSSFLVNAMIGGTLLSDGLGMGGDISKRAPKVCTVIVLLIGMSVAIYVHWSGQRPVNLIIFAQALTIVGGPVLAATLLWLATRTDLRGARAIPAWMKAVAAVSLVIVLFLALRTGVRIYLTMSH